MTARASKPPAIPDHEVIRVIGRGSYGEIWLARSVTGAWRAVKVIDRDTFENDRTFEREFLGMSSFEPISRAHPGFMDILHVGRSERYFFYIMELADDIDSGPVIDVEKYHPKTLQKVLEQRKSLPAEECIQLGLSLTEALSALHSHGLTHRDIKPANLIFVGGVPKLADIGLVAAHGQRSFVGTEGYVPPEGPGTPEADIYSLGKVLYEVAMGKDRMDFPEITTRLGEIDDKAPLLHLNEVLLKACAARVTKRYRTAREMHADLARLNPRKKIGWWLTGLGLAAVAMVAGLWLAFPHSDHVKSIVISDAPTPSPSPSPMPTIGTLTLQSSPEGAAIELKGANGFTRRGLSPISWADLPAGEFQITARWNTQSLSQSVSVRADQPQKITFPFKTGNGSVKLTSAPRGAEVWNQDHLLGETPLLIEELPPGLVNYQIKLPGFKPVEVRGTVAHEECLFLGARLEPAASPEADRPWTNSLGMIFVPVGKIWMSIWETRVRDYSAYCLANQQPMQAPDFPQDENHPMVLINWNDANAFCQWLTEKERREGLIRADQSYRLPTDVEWSEAAGLPLESGGTPEMRDGRIHKVFPWGTQWPPPVGAGNYADSSLPKKNAIIPGYQDGAAQTAPVGSYAQNVFGLQDLGGNVWEWCREGYKGESTGKDWGVLRGGSWANNSRTEIESSYRNVVDRNERDVIFGFRCVLAETAPETEPSP